MGTVPDVISLTRKLLSFNTVNPPGRETPCVRYIGGLLEEKGFKIGYHAFSKNRASLVARLEGGAERPPICFSGHVDTVPPGTARWSRDPFAGECDGDRIYGRGSSDMKGGVAAMVTAALELAGLQGRKAGISLVITAGEETGCRGAYHLARLDDVLERAGALVIGEPTSNYPLLGHKGALWIEARTTGVAAHGSMPELGVNAVYRAARVIRALENYDIAEPEHPLLGRPTLNVGTVSGGMNINSVPDSAVIGIDIRTVPGRNNAGVYEDLRALLGADVALERRVDVGPVSTDPDHEWVREVFRIMNRYLGHAPAARGASYFTDASALVPALGDPPVVILGPGAPETAHKTDEFCRISKIEEAASAYMEIARSWCCGKTGEAVFV